MMPRPCLTVLSLASVCLFLAIEAWATATLTETTLDGASVVIMENRFLRAVFEPGKGGTCTDLVHKPSGKRFVAPKVGRSWAIGSGTTRTASSTSSGSG